MICSLSIHRDYRPDYSRSLPSTDVNARLSQIRYSRYKYGTSIIRSRHRRLRAAGQKAALNAAKLGKRVALIDRKDLVGGVCIHTGTIPSKAIREADPASHRLQRALRLWQQLRREARHHDERSALSLPARRARPKWTSSATRCAATASRCFSATPASSIRNTIRVSNSREETGYPRPAYPGRRRHRTGAAQNVPFTPAKIIDSNGLLLLERASQAA